MPDSNRDTNEAIATGRCIINYDPLDVLRELNAAVGWSGGDGFVIRLGKEQNSYLFKRLTDCIAFNEGREK